MPVAPLTAAEARVLGSLIEKEVITPDTYPLSLNGLANACNQLTNREPVVSYDENTLVTAADGLRDKHLAVLFHGADSRVAKYRHTIGDVFPMTPAEIALIGVLLLRGPQTLGELRIRTERLYPFESLQTVEAALGGLATREPPLVTKFTRPGAKEPRYAHLLCGPVDTAARMVSSAASAPAAAAAPAAVPIQESSTDRVGRLETELSSLRAEVAALRAEFAAFRKQFE